MTTAHRFTVGLSIILGMLLLVVFFGWQKEHDEKVNAQAVLNAQTKVIADSQVREKLQLDNNKLVQANLEKQKQIVTTPAQIVKEVPKYITLPYPIHEATVDTAGTDATVPYKANADDLIIPAASTKAFFDAQVTCKENAANLDSCKLSVENYNTMDGAKNTEIKALQTQLKGGTKWHRTVTAAKWLGIGAIAGGVTVLAVHH